MVLDHSSVILFQLLRIRSQNDLYSVVYDSQEVVKKKKKKKTVQLYTTFETVLVTGSREAIL